jgi:hypothetical protein
VLLGVGLPLIFLLIMATSCDRIPPARTYAMPRPMNAMPNTGGSMGILI